MKLPKASLETIVAEPDEGKAASPRRPRRRAEETRCDILSVGEALFRKRGFAAVTIADIAAELAMSPANVFKHFHSKNALVDAIASRQIKGLEQGLSLLNKREKHLEPFQRLLNMAQMLMQSHLRDLKENPYIFEMILLVGKQELQCGQHYKSLIIESIADIIHDGIAKQIYGCDDPFRMAATVTHALSGVLHPVIIATENPDSLSARCEDLVRLIDAALQKPLAK